MKHYRKFLESLEDMSNRDMIKACEAAGLQKIGSGSCRVVFAINDKLVIKIALGHAGVEQNENEIRVWHMLDYDFNGYKKYFAKIHVDLCHYKDFFIVMERLETQFTGRRKYASDLFTVRFNNNISKAQRRPYLHYQAVSVLDYHLNYVNATDMHIRNLGLSANGCVKMLDFGLSKRTIYQHYGLSDRRRVKRELLK